MISPSNSGSARQLARKQGLARVSALTLGVGAAGVLGAVGIAATLANSTATSATTSANPATTEQGRATEQGTLTDDGDDGFRSQLQTATPPGLSDTPPDATSGGS